MPVLVLTGQKAAGLFLAEQVKLVASQVTVLVVEGSGHWSVDENPTQTLGAIATFLVPR
jgi:pimeloyl-ACP methyl ester carboxylesterase